MTEDINKIFGNTGINVTRVSDDMIEESMLVESLLRIHLTDFK